MISLALLVVCLQTTFITVYIFYSVSPIVCASVISSMSNLEKDSKHCHDSSRALEDREQEKKLARRRLYVVSAVCLVFMVGEILGMLVGLLDFFCYEENVDSLLYPMHYPLSPVSFVILGGCVNRWVFRWQSGGDDGCGPPSGGFHKFPD